jgi:FKBP-type peptidyl-prolyl cis-trans isomerase
VKKFQTPFLSIVTVVLIGFTLLSLANDTTPEEAKAKGAAFLAKNAKLPNIKITASGLQYEVLTKGTGSEHPKATDSVTVNFTAQTVDGQQFDYTEQDRPVTYPLSDVMAGWREGVQLMTEGAKFRFFIPTQLAYGLDGAANVGPNEALIYEIELLKIK